MSTTRTRWYILGLVLAVVAVISFSVALRPSPTITGSAAAVSVPQTTESPAGPTIRPPADGSASAPSGTSAPSSIPVLPPPTPQVDGAVGAETAGDPYYPDSGNGGYDATSYHVDFSFDPATKQLAAETTITAKITEPQKLGRFSFDLQPTMQVSQVLVGDVAAGFTQHDAKLVITPVTGLAADSTTTVVVTYTGEPAPIQGGTAGLADGGWYTTAGGGAAVLGEPYSASAWFPVNEHPTDRASFGITAQVPTGWQVISNGLPVADPPAAPAGFATFGWSEKSEMASYLTVLYIEKFTQTQDTSGTGLPIINAYGPGAEASKAVGDKTADYLEFLASKFGPYPFDSSGGIFLSDTFGFALETQTRPIYAGFSPESTVVHELAHQWFGDDVTVNRWADICLNECFASYAEWLWAEDGGADLDKEFQDIVSQNLTSRQYWSTPLYDMGAGNEFGVVYSRGPVALHALRAELGEEKFSELLLSWIEEHAGTSASWTDFESLVSKISGKDESAFLAAWFRGTTIPAEEFLYPGDLHP